MIDDLFVIQLTKKIYVAVLVYVFQVRHLKIIKDKNYKNYDLFSIHFQPYVFITKKNGYFETLPSRQFHVTFACKLVA